MQTGDKVEDFALPDQDGTVRRLSEFLATGPVVLFFYPAAMTSGCTRESCHFRDLEAEFAEVGAHRVGISADSVDKQHRFSDMHRFGYPLLSDPDRTVAEALGVRRMLRVLGPNRRTTFVIDTDGTILGVFDSQLDMNSHADEALALLRRRRSAAGDSGGG
jgi:thioredoxin-dependent peroxiredoxin